MLLTFDAIKVFKPIIIETTVPQMSVLVFDGSKIYGRNSNVLAMVENPIQGDVNFAVPFEPVYTILKNNDQATLELTAKTLNLKAGRQKHQLALIDTKLPTINWATTPLAFDLVTVSAAFDALAFLTPKNELISKTMAYFDGANIWCGDGAVRMARLPNPFGQTFQLDQNTVAILAKTFKGERGTVKAHFGATITFDVNGLMIEVGLPVLPKIPAFDEVLKPINDYVVTGDFGLNELNAYGGIEFYTIAQTEAGIKVMGSGKYGKGEVILTSTKNETWLGGSTGYFRVTAKEFKQTIDKYYTGTATIGWNQSMLSLGLNDKNFWFGMYG